MMTQTGFQNHAGVSCYLVVLLGISEIRHGLTFHFPKHPGFLYAEIGSGP